jgi:hypothetical protein
VFSLQEEDDEALSPQLGGAPGPEDDAKRNGGSAAATAAALYGNLSKIDDNDEDIFA